MKQPNFMPPGNEVDDLILAQPFEVCGPCQPAALDRDLKVRPEFFVLIQQEIEIVTGEEQQLSVIFRCDGGGAVAVFEERLLAEVIPTVKDADPSLTLLSSGYSDFNLSSEDHVKTIWRICAFEDHRPGGGGPVLKFDRNAGQLILIQPIEEMNLIEQDDTRLDIAHDLILSNFAHNGAAVGGGFLQRG